MGNWAQLDLREFSRGFSTQSHNWSLTVVFVLLLAGLAVILFWAWYASRKREQNRRFDSHDHLFLELARAHRLSRTERQLLRRLAQLIAVHADLFFVRSDLFDVAAENVGDDEAKSKVESLRRRLHAVAPEKDTNLEVSTAAGAVSNEDDETS